MVNMILQKIRQYAKVALAAAIQHSGTAALYFGCSTLLAGILSALILTYAWDIDQEKRYRAYAILRGIEIAEIQQAERDRAAEIHHDDVLERRAARLRQEEFERELTGQSSQFQLPPADPVPSPPPPPSVADRIDAYRQRVDADIAGSRTDGLAQLVDVLSAGSPEWSKEVIRNLWKEGQNRLVLQALLDLEERQRNRILFAMQETNAEELKDLCEILLRIAAGEPRTSILEEAAKEP